MKTIKKSLLPILIIIAFSILIYARQNGIVGRTLKGNTPGCTCHSSTPSGNVTVTINGPDEVAANDTANFTLTITGGTLDAGGTNIAALFGNLEADSGLKIISGELTHTNPKASEDGVVTFEFTYIAPSTAETDTIYANGLSANLTTHSAQWNFAPNKAITITGSTDIDDQYEFLSSYKLDQNYPNPFNPSTAISWQLPVGSHQTLKVYDLLGREVVTLVNEYKPAGSYEVEFDASSLSSGTYFYRLTAGAFVVTKKLILMK